MNTGEEHEIERRPLAVWCASSVDRRRSNQIAAVGNSNLGLSLPSIDSVEPHKFERTQGGGGEESVELPKNLDVENLTNKYSNLDAVFYVLKSFHRGSLALKFGYRLSLMSSSHGFSSRGSSSHSRRTLVNNVVQDSGYHCNCGYPCYVQTTCTASNQGRKFVNCPNFPHGCKIFHWCDRQMGPRSNVLMTGSIVEETRKSSKECFLYGVIFGFMLCLFTL